jgi:pentatricopeptide repeat protein
LRLTPRDPFASFYVSLIALAHYHLGNYEEAVHHSERALQRRRIYVVLRTLAASLAQLGRTEEARSVLAEMEQIKPINVVRHWELTCPYADPANEAHLLDGLRKAGWVGLERTQQPHCTSPAAIGGSTTAPERLARRE